jgi:glycosyltransferase involved in cell wall biosynthesis
VAEPFVSVIVPVYNAEKALPRLVASLRAQTYPKDSIELIMVDNGSTDRSRELLIGFPEVTLLSHTEWQGPAATRNEGVRGARGEVLAFIDADCWADPEWLERGVKALTERPFDRVAGHVEMVLSPHPNIYELYDRAVNFRQTDFVSAGWSGTGNLFVWKRVFDEVGLFEPSLISHEDSEWGLRATEAGKSLGYAADARVCHRARQSLKSLVKKWIRTEYGAAQVYRRRGILELHLWMKKSNWRPLCGTWRTFPEPIRSNEHLRMTFDLMANVLRGAGNLGSFLGYYGVGRGGKKRLQGGSSR